MTNILPSADIAQTGFVDFADRRILALNWLLDSNSPGFDPNTDLNYDDRVDFEDFAFLAENWLMEGI